MTVRNPIELQMQRNTDKIENCGNIVLIIGLNKEYENPNHVISTTNYQADQDSHSTC